MTLARRGLFAGLAGLLNGCSPATLLNVTVSRQGFMREADIAYGSDPRQKLDLYRPEKSRTDGKTVVFFHGGSWDSGAKGDYLFVAQALASSGYTVVIPDYRLYPSVRFPAFVNDGARAVRWTADRVGTDKVFVMGHSAGAHIAAMLALDPDFLKAVGLDRDRLKGVIGLAGPYDFMPITDPQLRDVFAPREKFAESQPIFYVDGRNPPLFLIHGEDDQDVRVDNTRHLAQAVRDAGGPVDTLIYDKMSHPFAVAALSNPVFTCGTPDPDPLREIVKWVRSHARAP